MILAANIDAEKNVQYPNCAIISAQAPLWNHLIQYTCKSGILISSRHLITMRTTKNPGKNVLYPKCAIKCASSTVKPADTIDLKVRYIDFLKAIDYFGSKILVSDKKRLVSKMVIHKGSRNSFFTLFPI